ncbi:uncharacterized protein LOC129976566 [Argiope bruennichi]|uniref:uncharacterized protein LOC129976566 n=1 Tax=Argiope bruennichi TaxID=94029 RepID=UPI002494A614|nr:uncharacterized protein LOC129976566 [Argiope bruennichi]
MPSDAMQLTPHNGEKISRYIEPSEEKEAHIHQTKDKNLGNRPSPGSDKDSKSRGSGKQKKEESKIVDIAKSSSQAPYTDIHVNNNNMNSKELPEDAVYFPPIIPDSRRVVGKNITSTIKSASVASTKTLVSNERLIEFNTKQAGKKDNSIDSSNHASSHRKEHTLPKSETTKEFISHSYYSPTPPSLITVSSDNDDSHQLYDSKRTRSKTNRTDTYILEMKPSLFPDKPGSNRPRKPNIKITSAMLAGILIAALIFLGFLTGTMVFVFHQLKFRSRSSKKTDRHKKRATVYAPEYLDEAFAGNTYIHNNIFLPNPQNLEERLSPEMDTTFSVDTDETTQAADHAPTSSSYVNTRNKSIHRHDDIISD